MLFSCKGQNGSFVTDSNTNKQDSITATGKTVAELYNSIWVVFQDKNNRYWFGSNGKGIYCYDGKNLKQYTTQDGLCSNSIRGIQEDKFGNIFFDTPDGVSKFDGKKFIFLKPIKSNQWKSEPDDLWFKGNGDIIGAYRYDGDSLYLLEFSSTNSKIFNSDYCVYSISKDKQGNIWFGTLSSGACWFDGETFNWIYEKELSVLADGRVPGVRSIIEDKDGMFWLSNILNRYKINHKTFEYEKLKGIEAPQEHANMKFPYFNSAVTDNETGDLWMTSYSEGVWKYDGKELNNYRIKDDVTDVLIVSIYKDKQGILWLATDNAGVYKFNGTTFEKFKP